jgi:transposase
VPRVSWRSSSEHGSPPPNDHHRLTDTQNFLQSRATALAAAIGDVQRFASGRQRASWLGLTAREHSTGERRRLGRISKRGDVYLRTLLIHGARAVLNASSSAAQRGRPLDRLRTWALATRQRCGYNKATVALANKLARIVWATWKYQRPFDGNWAARAGHD